MSVPFKILVLAHDLADAAIARRVAMLQAGGARVSVAGFRRGAPVATIAGLTPVDLGRTQNGGFVQRIRAVLREIIFLPRRRALFTGIDLILARNLEMLALAVRGRSLCDKRPTIVYEVLDIHRLMLGRGIAGAALRRLEGWLGRSAAALLTSSPAFVAHYFQPLSHLNLPVHIVENKALALNDAPPPLPQRPTAPPFVIGWFGIIRCRKSLELLTELARRHPGKFEVIIRGKPAPDQFDDFHAAIAGVPGLSFRGPYRPDELAEIYGSVHFSWAIDLFEAGQNSSWLLPNRLYEGGCYGAVPIAQAGVATGDFLRRRNLGVTLAAPLDQALADFAAKLTPESYRALSDAAAHMPRGQWVCGALECRDLVDYLRGLAHG